jgi:hypothetical protein
METLEKLMEARYHLPDVNMKVEDYIELLKEYAGFWNRRMNRGIVKIWQSKEQIPRS